MRKFIPVLLLSGLVACGGEQPVENTAEIADENPAIEMTFGEYPSTHQCDSAKDYHGTLVKDPYQWLENESAEEVEGWVNRQREFTESYLAQSPNRERLRERLGEIWNYEKQSAPWKEGDHYYFYKNDGTQNHSVLYFKKGEAGEEKVFLDPNTFSEDGTAALTGTYFSEDGKYCTYSVSKAGSDWREFHVRDIENETDLEDHIQWVKFSGASWDANGFFYSRYEAPVEGQEYSQKNQQSRVYYHKLGTNPTSDPVVHADNKNPEYSFAYDVHQKEEYVFKYTWASTSGNQLHYAKSAGYSSSESMDWTLINYQFDYDFSVVDIVDGKFLIYTNYKAPKYKLISIDPADTKPDMWVDVLPETEHVLEGVSVINGKLVAKYLENVQSKMYIYGIDGAKESEVELPGIGMASGVTGKKEDDFFYYSFVDYTRPASIYRYDFSTSTSTPYFEPEMNFASDEFETKQVWYTSKDGTKIPMFITHRKGLEIDGNNPTFLFGYGGFNISYTPEFRLDRTVFLENGGIYAVANLRGGGEFGEEWHTAGTKENKQNVFDDFIAAAEYLIAEGYTNSEKLAVHGRSNGGLLIGACMTQRPDLFKVAIPKVGVLDMLKFHEFTIGKYWTVDFGCSENAEDFEYLYKYSPVHNVTEQEYPATLVVTGDHDDRVVPAHSYKFISELQAKQKGDLPVMIRIDADGGHGSGKPVAMQIEEFADTWAFVFHHLGMTAR